jgi:hypothetical protein
MSIEIDYKNYPSIYTMALGLAQLLTEITTKNVPGG